MNAVNFANDRNLWNHIIPPFFCVCNTDPIMLTFFVFTYKREFHSLFVSCTDSATTADAVLKAEGFQSECTTREGTERLVGEYSCDESSMYVLQLKTKKGKEEKIQQVN